MIFFLVMPGLFGGFGNYFVPIFQGSPEVVYPRVNNFSILILSLSYLFVMFSFLLEKSIMDGVYVIFILVEHHLFFFFYFYILEELYFIIHIFIIQILGFLELFFSSS